MKILIFAFMMFFMVSNAIGQQYHDPHEYCRTVGRSDDPNQDSRYRGPPLTEDMAVVHGETLSELKKVYGKDAVAAILVWRCARGKVLTCLQGNAPICYPADTSRTPSEAMIAYCRENPNDEGIPAADTGHATIYMWKCAGRKPVIIRQVVRVDAEGYDAELWNLVPRQLRRSTR